MAIMSSGLKAQVPMFKEWKKSTLSKQNREELPTSTLIKKEIMQDHDHDEEEIKKAKTKLIRIRLSDPDATESSSSDEEEEKRSGNKRKDGIIYVAEISLLCDILTLPWSRFNQHQNQEKYQSLHGKERRETRTRRGKTKKKQSTSSSVLSSGDGDDQILSFNAMGLPDLPGPIPDNLDKLMHESSNLLANFFDGVPED